MTTTIDYNDLSRCVGLDLGKSAEREIRQQDVTAFADLTDDHFWIHVDEAAAAEGPFGATIAHGLLTLAMTATFWIELFQVRGARLSLNYGFDGVRFAAPVRVGQRVRMTASIPSVTPLVGGFEIAVDQRILVSDEAKPAVAARALYRYYG